MNAKSKEDIRKADKQMIKDVSNSNADSRVKAVIKAGIKAKTIGENLGVLPSASFSKFQGSGKKQPRKRPVNLEPPPPIMRPDISMGGLPKKKRKPKPAAKLRRQMLKQYGI